MYDNQINLKTESIRVIDEAINHVILNLHKDINLDGFISDTVNNVNITTEDNCIIISYKRNLYATLKPDDSEEKLSIRIDYAKQVS